MIARWSNNGITIKSESSKDNWKGQNCDVKTLMFDIKMILKQNVFWFDILMLDSRHSYFFTNMLLTSIPNGIIGYSVHK